MLHKDNRGFVLSSLVLLLVLPAMLLAASCLKVLETGGETVAVQMIADKVNYITRDAESVIKSLLQIGASIDDNVLKALAERYRETTGLLIDITGIDSDGDKQIDTVDIFVRDPRSAAVDNVRLEFFKLAVGVYPDKPVYVPGENAYFTVYVGTVYGTAVEEAAVNLTVFSPSGDNVFFSSGVTDDKGNWTVSFTKTTKLGTYLAVANATKGGKSGSGHTTFEVKHEIRITIDKPMGNYSPGEEENALVKLKDEIGTPISGAHVEFEILDENNLRVIGPCAMSGDNGVYGRTFTVPPYSGTYYFSVSARKSGYSDGFAFVQFTVG